MWCLLQNVTENTILVSFKCLIYTQIEENHLKKKKTSFRFLPQYWVIYNIVIWHILKTCIYLSLPIQVASDNRRILQNGVAKIHPHTCDSVAWNRSCQKQIQNFVKLQWYSTRLQSFFKPCMVNSSWKSCLWVSALENISGLNKQVLKIVRKCFNLCSQIPFITITMAEI